MQTAPKARTLLTTRLSSEERDALLRIARTADRTPSREIRRAIRYYIAHLEEADRYLRDAAEATR